MTEFLEFLIGHDLNRLAEGKIHLGASPWVIEAGAVGLIAVIWLLYYRTTVAVSGWAKALMVGLKSVVLILLFLSFPLSSSWGCPLLLLHGSVGGDCIFRVREFVCFFAWRF